MKKNILLTALVLINGAIAPMHAQENAPFPAPKNTGDPAKLGLGIQRTMTLLETSTPQKRNTVRILFYGQSITEGSWWKAVADDLKKRFPHANLIIENRALGGFSSQRLIHTAESDLYSFYPDLMIFHVYGSHLDYESIIRRTRERTTSEILIQTDHANKDANLTEETAPAKITGMRPWDSFMNYVFLPGIVKKYDTGVVDQRNLWKQYLRDNNLRAQQLLKDGVHPNEHGNYLMAELAKAYLVRRPEIQVDPYNSDTVKTLVVGKDVQWQNGKLTIPFNGNRVDVIAQNGTAPPASVLIDNVKPSALPELYGFTRANSTPGGKWPVIRKVGSEKLPLLEEWTMQVTKDPAKEDYFTFTLSGSQTGPDGAGNSATRFVSNSGRVVIEPADWDVKYALGLPGIKIIPDTFTVKWKAVPQFVDEFIAPANIDPTIENIVTVAQGLKNGPHTLEISGSPDTPIAAIRIYQPPLARDVKPN